MPDAKDAFLQTADPIIKFRWLVNGQGFLVQDPEVLHARQRIPESPRVQALLAGRDEQGRLPHHPYQKWLGAHWVLALLAEWGYPQGDPGLIPLRDQELEWLLSPAHQKNIRQIAGRTRRCASQEGNALYSLLSLGLADERCDELARRLASWQWPDGGWNCDKHPEAFHSSFHESLIPMRALALHARLTGNPRSKQAAENAAEVFLSRRLFHRLKDGGVIDPHFLALHYPFYWHYDVLFGLLGMAEGGWIKDPRCKDALDWLESRRLPNGNFPADEKWYTVTQRNVSGRSSIDWGGTSPKVLNPFVSVLARSVLKMAGLE